MLAELGEKVRLTTKHIVVVFNFCRTFFSAPHILTTLRSNVYFLAQKKREKNCLEQSENRSNAFKIKLIPCNNPTFVYFFWGNFV